MHEYKDLDPWAGSHVGLKAPGALQSSYSCFCKLRVSFLGVLITRTCYSRYTYIHTYMHAYIRTYIHTYMHAYIHTDTCVKLRTPDLWKLTHEKDDL